MTRLRRLYYFLGTPILRGLLRLGTATYRLEAVIGAENIEPFLDGKAVCAPAYWHQHHVLCSDLVKSWVKRGFNDWTLLLRAMIALAGVTCIARRNDP